MSEGYITIPKIAEETNIPASTVRRYLEQHNHTLRTKKNARGAWLLREEDISLIREIRSCYERKMSSDEVEDYLLQSGQPLTVTMDDDQELTITPAKAFMQLAGEVQRLQEEIATTKQQLSSAHEEIKELKKAQETSSEKQQASMIALTDDLKSVSEGISRLEREKQKKKEKPFWSRLFKS